MRDGKLVGFASERDIVFRVVAGRLDPLETKVADIMSSPVTTATMESGVEECEQIMRRSHVRHLPILDKGKIVVTVAS